MATSQCGLVPDAGHHAPDVAKRPPRMHVPVHRAKIQHGDNPGGNESLDSGGSMCIMYVYNYCMSLQFMEIVAKA